MMRFVIGAVSIAAYVLISAGAAHSDSTAGNLMKRLDAPSPGAVVKNGPSYTGFASKAIDPPTTATSVDALMSKSVPVQNSLSRTTANSVRAPARVSKQVNLVTNIPKKGRKYNQLAQRGWTQESVDQVVNNPYTTSKSINRETGNKATAYFREDGHHIVRDNVTHDIVQMSDTRLVVGRGQGQWIPDDDIVNPYIP